MFWRKQVHNASHSPKGIWKLAKWARTRGTEPIPLPQFPKLNNAAGALTGVFTEQVDILRAKFFPKPREADLSDINGTAYPNALPTVA